MYHAPFDARFTRSVGVGNAYITTITQPGIFVVCDTAKLDGRGCLGVPDWIIEIVSPGNLKQILKPSTTFTKRLVFRSIGWYSRAKKLSLLTSSMTTAATR